jgi:hypothetical protein
MNTTTTSRTVTIGGVECESAVITFDGNEYLAPFIDLLPTQDADTLARLKEDIRRHGKVLAAVVVTDDDPPVVLDGHTRLTLALEIGLTDHEVPFKRLPAGMPYEQMKREALALNVNRRHLSTEERREFVAHLIRQNPDLSDRAIAAQAGVSHSTSGSVRKELVASGQVVQTETRTDRRGVKHPAQGKTKTKDRPEKPRAAPLRTRARWSPRPPRQCRRKPFR